MLARRLATILPATRLAEALETTRLHRVALYRGECQPTLMSAGNDDDTEAIMGGFP
jgi:predicted ATPase with chaperone activity